MSSEDFFADVSSVVNLNPTPGSPQSLGSTPIDCSGVIDDPGPAAAGENIVSLSKGPYSCPVCEKVLKSKSGYTRHTAAHKINDYIFRQPEEETITEALPTLMKTVISEIISEPAVGEIGSAKRSFMQEFNSEDSEFLQEVSTSLMDIVLTKKKVMPSAHYEDALSSLNHVLANPLFYECLKPNFLLCVPEHLRSLSDSLVQRLIWRITSKLFMKMQEVIFSKMRKNHIAEHSDHVMSEGEVESFKSHISRILRNLYRLGVKSGNAVWKLRCKSMREKFAVGFDISDENYTVSSKDFVESKLWIHPVKISLSEHCVNLFISIEKIAQSLQGKNLPCTADIVFDKIFSPENLIILNDMRALTQGICSEEVALEFLREITKSLVKLSMKWDAIKKREIAKSYQKTQSVATRADLKRNPKKKGKSGQSEQEAGNVLPPPADGQQASTSQDISIPPMAQNKKPSEPKGSKKDSSKKKNPVTKPLPSKKSIETEASQVETATRKSSRVRKPVQR